MLRVRLFTLLILFIHPLTINCQEVTTLINQPSGDDIHFYKDYLYTTDYGSDVIRKISMDGQSSIILKGYPKLGAIEIVNGTIYATNYDYGYLLRFREGEKPDTIITGMAGPSGIVASRDGDLYINQNAAAVVTKLNKEGQLKPLLKGPPLNWNTAITVDPDNNVYTNNMWTGEIIRIDPKGGHKVITELPAKLDTDPDLGYMDFHGGLIYALHLGNSCLYVVDPETGFYATYAGQDRKAGWQDGSLRNALFDHPVGIELDVAGKRIFITDGPDGKQRLRMLPLLNPVDFKQNNLSIENLLTDTEKVVYDLQAKQAIELEIEIRDAADVAIKNMTWQLPANSSQKSLDLSELDNGVYFINLKAGEFKFTHKVNKP